MNVGNTLKRNRTLSGKSLTRTLALGFGGAGIDFIAHLMEADLTNVHCVAADTDPYHLQIAKAHSKVSIRGKIDSALRSSAISGRDLGEVSDELKPFLKEADVVFVLAGMGGGTGGAVAPSVAETARKMGALTLGIVTPPFHFERARFRPAIDSIRQMLNVCDTTILLDNHRPDSSTPILPFRFSLDSPGQTACAIVESISHTLIR